MLGGATAYNADGSLRIEGFDVSGAVVVKRMFTGSVVAPVMLVKGAVKRVHKISTELSMPATKVSGSANVYVLQKTEGAITAPAMTVRGVATTTPAPSIWETDGEAYMTAISVYGAAKVKPKITHEPAGEITVSAIKLSGAVKRVIGVSGGTTLNAMQINAKARMKRSATGELVFDAPEIAGEEKTTIKACGEISFPDQTIEGGAKHVPVIYAQGAIALDPFEASADGQLKRVATGNISLPAMEVSGAEKRKAFVSGEISFPAVDIYGRGHSSVVYKAQLYRVIEIRRVYGKNNKIAILEATRRPINK